LGHWNLDAWFGKGTAIKERVHVNFAADFFNLFNHVIYCDPDVTNGKCKCWHLRGKSFPCKRATEFWRHLYSVHPGEPHERQPLDPAQPPL